MGTTVFYKELPWATEMSPSWPTAGSPLFQMAGPLEGCVSCFSGFQTPSFSTRSYRGLLRCFQPAYCRQSLSLYTVPSILPAQTQLTKDLPLLSGTLVMLGWSYHLWKIKPVTIFTAPLAKTDLLPSCMVRTGSRL